VRDDFVVGDAIELPGTIRTEGAATTLARAQRVMRSLGITRVANVTGLDHVGIPTWVAVRPLARSLTVSQGKGLTDDLARASAVMECIELHHAEHFVPRGEWRSLRAAMQDERFADPLLFHVHPTTRIDVSCPVEWVPGHDLIANTSRWVPRDCIDIDTVTVPDHHRMFIATSNGLASGNSAAEAKLHALCEVIERDQQSFWYACKRLAPDPPRSRLRLESVTDAHCRWLLGKCAAAGLEVVVWCATQELGLPTFVCTLFDRHRKTSYPHRATGSGCHPYRRIALSRAITEALQSRLTHIVGGRDDILWSSYRDRLRVDDEQGHAWGESLVGEPEGISFDAVPEAPPMNAIGELLDWVLAELSANGFAQAIAVDLTQDSVAIPVVHVSVSGLEGEISRHVYTPGPRMQKALAGWIAA